MLGRGALALVCACMCALGLSAQASDDEKQDEPALTASETALDKGHYLAAQEALTPRAFDPQGKPRDGMVYSNWSLFQAFMTNEPAPAQPWSPSAPSASVVAAIAHARLTDPIAEIVRRARSTRIVILNEDHWVPRDRAFALQVARALRRLGYDVLAAETFNNSPQPAFAEEMRAKLERDGYPRRSSGYYTQDPVFGDFVRQALHLGYHPLLYEATTHVPTDTPYDSIVRRDQEQAENLVAHTLKAYPRSKILVYVGFDHATEAPMPSHEGKEIEWMAARLKRLSGIDPLTIDQTVLSPLSGGNPALYALVAPRLRGRPAMLMADSAPLVVGRFAGKVDLQIAHPVAVRVDGRPDWLRSMGRRPVAVPANLIPVQGTRLIKAYIATEAEDAVPVDQVLVTAGKPLPKLMLPPGRIRYEVEDAAS
jgi:hypothetical protein